MSVFSKLSIAILLCTWLVQGCDTRNKAFIEKVKNADSVAINYFAGNGRMDSVVGIKIVRNKQQTEQLSEFIAAGGNSESYKCGYDGSIHYFLRGMVLQDVYFRMNDVQCMHFSFLLNGNIQAAKLSPEARQWLTQQKP